MKDVPEVTPAAEEPEIAEEPQPEPEPDTTPEPEPEPTPEPEPEPAEEIEDLRKKAKGFEDQKKRAEKAEAELRKLKGEKPDPKPDAPAVPNDDTTRARLEARGVLDEDMQNEVLEAARMLGIYPVQALDRPLVKARLEEIKAEKAAKDATPPPRSGPGRPPQTQNVSALADKVEKGGDLPSNPALAEKVQKELARRAHIKA
jgi:hypothetical protein